MGNPTQSSLFTGKGLPWGPMNTSRPDRPNYVDPSQVQGFDSSAIRQQLGERMGMAGKEAQGQYLSGQSKLMGGVAKSSGAGTGLQNIATDTERNKSLMDAELAWKDWQDRRSLANELNNFNQQSYNTGMNEYTSEQGQRQNALGGMLGLVGTLGGSYLGGLGGAAAGGLAGKAPMGAASAADELSYVDQLIAAGLDPDDVEMLSYSKKRSY